MSRALVARTLLTIALVTLAAVAPSSTVPTDPAQNLARVRLIVTSTAGKASVTVDGANIASYISTVLAGADGTRSTQLGQTMQVSNATPGQQAEAQFDVILAGVTTAGKVTWNLTTDAAAQTQLEVYSLASLNSPRAVDRFTTTGASAQFSSSGTLLASDGQVAVSPFGSRLVLAHYYPWYTLDTWHDPQFLDQPQPLYSTASPDDVNAEAQRAHSAGIDAFVVSWNGADLAAHGTNDPRTRLVLDAARRVNMQACVYAETDAANPAGNPNLGPDPATMLQWLQEIVDLYSSHPAYLKVDTRPVIFIYSSWLIAQQDWIDLRARLRASGRDPFLVGDFYHSRLLEVFDGEYQYSSVTLSASEIRELDRVETLRVRTFNLLRANDARRLWVASVAPGYNDTRLVSRPTHLVVDRAGGAVYDAQWSAAIDLASDWVIVTTWNEWYENTAIEPSRLYALLYLDRTRAWAAVFKAQIARQRPPDAPVTGTARPRG